MPLAMFRIRIRVPEVSPLLMRLVLNISDYFVWGIIIGCYICYYIITGGYISIRMVLLTMLPKYGTAPNKKPNYTFKPKISTATLPQVVSFFKGDPLIPNYFEKGSSDKYVMTRTLGEFEATAPCTCLVCFRSP